MTKEQLLSIIYDVVMYKLDTAGKTKNDLIMDNYDRIFYDYMKKTYKLKKVTGNKLEGALMAINKYSGKKHNITNIFT